ncbi:ATP-dependent Clp protease ATP-binding subunit [Lactiplantibacillus plantarum]|uniref:AAA family ATPase n=1 Tax=Lactiplantibacillus plantarum TaxID=1590 RepID=UPI00203AF0B0|nr:ATP-dependent Clp protease ATP-binding subunit [Lactiplantibacillus plantarum]MCM2587422.1 ATP-dependent Clp protease ATP-binding subunit [Lactiplantibacillus plantarum]MCM2598402.1 ATP-dependent Clp protease ATP-binding subunit [Lactiplantibacillus plantarum]MCM2602818.1 ATP-dependent Clp protease ATP-binding subunit [Lactiplantibacillus plantarum]MCM2607275.1 ATP-dependent Clp protease ATP-binding subunit [Lactiplantibacillus plantarum]MCM2610713.1 ATP-dependent Clp protease ATP-binding s
MSLLTEYTQDLTKVVEANPDQYQTIGRDQEIEQLVETLCRKNKRNPLVIAPPGVGKTNLIEGLAKRIVTQQVPPELQAQPIYVFELAQLKQSDQNFMGLFKALLTELQASRAMVFIDEIHTIVGTGSDGDNALDVSNVLKPALARGEITLIGATTTKEYHRFLEKDGALARRFDVIQLAEPSVLASYQILGGLKASYEAYHDLTIDATAMKTAVDYAVRYLPDRYLPDKAFDLLDESCAYAKAHALKAVTPVTVAKVIEQRKHIPLHQIMKNRQAQLNDVQRRLNQNIKGQPQAIQGVLDALTLYFAGFQDPTKPISSFLFLGIPGTGKTETAKQLAQAMFGSPDALIRFDMSEYNDQDAVHRLLGTADAGGTLTEAVKHQPFAIVLLDEIEKGSHDVQDLFLQVLQDGILHDSDDQLVSFKNTIIIMTTNLAAKVVNDQQQFNHLRQGEQRQLQFKAVVEKALKNEFRPEFVNRIEHKIIFNMLDEKIGLAIATKYLKEFKATLAQRQLKVDFSPEVAQYLATVGFDVTNGARPIAYMLNAKIKAALARELLQQDATQVTKYHYLVRVVGRWPGVFQGQKDRFGDLKVIIEAR